jgi:hypothetical protein
MVAQHWMESHAGFHVAYYVVKMPSLTSDSSLAIISSSRHNIFHLTNNSTREGMPRLFNWGLFFGY